VLGMKHDKKCRNPLLCEDRTVSKPQPFKKSHAGITVCAKRHDIPGNASTLAMSHR
jgi:hypothetical protein